MKPQFYNSLRMGIIALLCIMLNPFVFSQVPDVRRVTRPVRETTRDIQRNNREIERAAEDIKELTGSEADSQATTGEEASAAPAAPSASGKKLYVSRTSGHNRNDGTKDSPLRNIDRAIANAEPGTDILVAGGVYMGTLNVGYLETDKPVRIYGSWDEDFTKQDIKAHPTLIQPTNETARSTRRALLRFTRDVAGTVLDHIVFDGGERNAYHPEEGVVEGVEGGRLLPPTQNPPSGFPTVGEPLVQFVSATTGGDVTIQNCVFVNGPSFALQAGHRSGTFTVRNNVFVANKMAAIEIYGTCANPPGPGNMSRCGEVEIAHNTILFNWSRLPDFLDMGYGVRIMTRAGYNIHHNIIGASILAGVDHTRFNDDDWIKVDNNIFFVNKDEDLHYSPASNIRMRINAIDFDELEFASARNNINEIPAGLKVNMHYLEGYLNARYSEETDFDRNSPANQWRSMMGMNLQGTMTTSVTMFGNKYPWQDALLLFGNVQGFGAQ